MLFLIKLVKQFFSVELWLLISFRAVFFFFGSLTAGEKKERGIRWKRQKI